MLQVLSRRFCLRPKVAALALAMVSRLPPRTSGTQIFSMKSISTAPSPVVGKAGGASAAGAAGGAVAPGAGAVVAPGAGAAGGGAGVVAGAAGGVGAAGAAGAGVWAWAADTR